MKLFFDAIKKYAVLLRVNQWIKNFLVFLPVFFGGSFLNNRSLVLSLYTFLCFCFSASAIYIYNDLLDYDFDCQHFAKKNRPIACNKISKKSALIIQFFLIISASFFVFIINNFYFTITILSYFFLNALYSGLIKYIAVYEIVCVASFYLLRILAGGFATGIPVSNWLFLCIFFFALFLVSGKRRAEFVLTEKKSRPVLLRYNEKFLDLMVSISISFGFFTYVFYIVTLKKPLWAASIVVMAILVFKLIFKVFVENKGEYPEKMFLCDFHIIFLVASWIIINIFSIYVL